ncbi:MAG: hypothetical protein ACLS7X_01465 [Mediterraneibacter gnavus]
MRRYERPHINEVWCGDSSVGPRLTDSDGKKHRIYIIALIDDASRFITGIDVFYHDNFINLMSVMKSAIAKYGRPKFSTLTMVSLTKTGKWNSLPQESVQHSVTASHTLPPEKPRLNAGSGR